MFMFHRRFCQLNSLYLVFCFLLAAGFAIQLKIFYHTYQKNVRLADYKERVTSMSDSMNNVARLANTTSELMTKLQRSLNVKINKKS